jgi:hypothetical protein
LPSTELRTPQLITLLEAAARRSVPRPRPGNPGARRAPISVYGAVCERHEFEAAELPRARAAGWPSEINWISLRSRVEKLGDMLSKIIMGQDGAREKSRFWAEVEHDMKKVGSRTVTGVKGQFESFEKVQPG